MKSLPAHGVLIQLDGLGIYLIGASGVGKSETALQLIHQGARLICDDAPEFTSGSNNRDLMGVCPSGFYGQMHLRDLGVINIMELLGKQYFKVSQRIDFVIELINVESPQLVQSPQLAKSPQLVENHQAIESHLQPQYQHWQYQRCQQPDEPEQSWTIPGMLLHFYTNRNIPLLIKTAVMQFLLSRKKVGEKNK